ncbi:MAG TPA: hypothetical protein VNL14_19650 [Candidatus Acidoferrales bacterium]|nr:hypothetical protein [Candidatus Acidoferrales bacterium]
MEKLDDGIRETRPNVDAEREGADLAEPPSAFSYAQLFRTIASALAKLQVESFDLNIKEGVCEVRGFAKALPGPSEQRAHHLTGAWRRLRSRFFSPPAGAPFELRYTRASLRELELAGIAQRTNALRYPEPESFTETLRAVGAFLDSKGAKLSRLSMRGRWITLEYKSPQGHLVVEEHTAASLYSFWASMCAQRANAGQISPGPKHFRVDIDETG